MSPSGDDDEDDRLVATASAHGHSGDDDEEEDDDDEDDDEDHGSDPYEVKPGLTAASGQIVVDTHIAGTLWAGRVLQPRERAVVIQLRAFPYAPQRAHIDDLLRYEVEGIAPLVFLGYPDGFAVTEQQYREQTRDHRGHPPAMIAEVRPDGESLATVAPLAESDAIRVGIGLCDTVAGWIAARAPSEGLTPETVYVAGAAGKRYFAGATPRVYLFDGSGSHEASFADARYGGPMSGPIELAPADATFMVAQLIWFAATGEHAYGPGDGVRGMEEDRRRPFMGAAALGQLLERVLLFDEQVRIGLEELRRGLLDLAGAMGVELPPFPPPGLAHAA